MHAGIEEIDGDSVVMDRRNRDRDGIDHADQCVMVGKDLGPGVGGGRLGASPIGIDDTNQPSVRTAGIMAGMMASENAQADDANPDALPTSHTLHPNPSAGAPSTILGRHVRRGQPGAPLKNCNTLKYGATAPKSRKTAAKSNPCGLPSAQFHPIAKNPAHLYDFGYLAACLHPDPPR